MRHSIFFSLLLTLLLSSSAFAKAPIFVTADWVFENQKNIKLIDLSPRSEYQKLHLPNAIWVSYDWLIKPQNGLHLSGGKYYMANLLSQLGVKPDDHIVLYDSKGNLTASRLYWELIKLKHNKVSILDGGIVSWLLNNFPVTQSHPKIIPSHYPVPKIDLYDFFTADKAEVLAAIDDPNILIVDTRTEEEFIGSPNNKRSGHIPTAILLPWDISVNHRNGFKQRSDDQLIEILSQLNLGDKNKTIILYCNTAHRAARLIPMFQHLGYKNIKMYDASIQEWSLDPNLPLKRGIKP